MNVVMRKRIARCMPPSLPPPPVPMNPVEVQRHCPVQRGHAQLLKRGGITRFAHFKCQYSRHRSQFTGRRPPRVPKAPKHFEQGSPSTLTSVVTTVKGRGKGLGRMVMSIEFGAFGGAAGAANAAALWFDFWIARYEARRCWLSTTGSSS